MHRSSWWAATVLVAALSACGTNNITDLTGTPTPASLPSATPSSIATVPETVVPTATGLPSATAPVAAPTSTATVTATPTATGSATPVEAIVLFSADASDPANPFPSDRLRDATGHIALPPAYLTYALPPAQKYNAARTLVATTAAQLAELDGFGTFTPLRIRFSRPMVVPAGENPRGIWLLEYDNLSARPVLVSATAYAPNLSIEVQPILPLKPKTRYALVVTSDITDIDGNQVKPSPDFAKLLAGTDLSPAQTAWRAVLAPVISFVNTGLDIHSDALALVEVFTTESTTDDLVAIQHRISSGDLVPGMPVFENAPIKDLDTGIFPEGTKGYSEVIGTDQSANVAAVAIGVFDSYDFRTGPKGGFDPRYVNGPDVPKVNHLDFYMTIPKAPMPANGYPISLFGHGLGGSGRDVREIASVDSGAPIMGIAISAVQHGLRGNVLNFFVLDTITTTRENFRQTAADFLQLTKMIENAHAAGIKPFDMIDPQSIYYLGGSLGGIIGTLYMAVEPDVQTGVLSVPGGGLLNIIDSHDIGMLIQPLISLISGISLDDPFYPEFLHGFRQTAQWGIERADPIDYAPYMIVPGARLPGVPPAPKRILMHEGIVDNVMPNRTTDDLALAMHLPDLNVSHGCMNASGCSGIWRYVMTDYGKNEGDGHPVTITVPQATQQAFDYLSSAGTMVDDEHP